MNRFVTKTLSMAALALTVVACNDDDSQDSVWDRYADWREANEAWFAEQEVKTNPDGTPFYTRVSPAWTRPGAARWRATWWRRV